MTLAYVCACNWSTKPSANWIDWKQYVAHPRGIDLEKKRCRWQCLRCDQSSSLSSHCWWGGDILLH